MVEIGEVQGVAERLVEGFGRLIPQLSSTSRPPTAEKLRALVELDASVLYAAWEGGLVVGTLTLVLMRLPTGIRARIEDIVVDEAS